MTPTELFLHLEAWNDERETQLEAGITNAYLTAAWGHAARMPSLNSVLSSIRRKKNLQPDDIAKRRADHEALTKLFADN